MRDGVRLDLPGGVIPGDFVDDFEPGGHNASAAANRRGYGAGGVVIDPGGGAVPHDGVQAVEDVPPVVEGVGKGHLVGRGND